MKFSSVMVAVLFILMYVLPIVQRRFGGIGLGARDRSSFVINSILRHLEELQQPNAKCGSPQQPQRGGTNLAGVWAGSWGLLFSSLGFGAAGAGGLGGGIGLMDILLIGLVLYGIYWFMKKRRMAREAPAGTQYYQGEPARASYQPSYGETPVSTGKDVSSGLSHIRRMDPSFSEEAFRDQSMDFFFKLQACWANRDMAGMRKLLTDDMYRTIR